MAIRTRWAAALLATALVAACTRQGDAPPPAGRPTNPVRQRTASTTTLPDLSDTHGLAASIRQYREDEAVGAIQVQLVRASGAPGSDVTVVRSVQLDWPGFAAVEPTVRTVSLSPGRRIDVPTPLGAAVCDGRGTPPFSDGSAILEVDLPRGARTVRAPLLADAQRALDNVHSKACVRQALDRAVALDYDAAWARSDRGATPAAVGTLVVDRRATDAPIRVVGVDGSVLLVVTPLEPLGPGRATLPAGEDSMRVGVRVVASGRCDGHALGDSKKTYVFDVQVAVGDDAPVGAEVTVPETERDVLASVIADTCASVRGG